MFQDSPTLTTVSTLTCTLYSCITRTAVKQLKPHILHGQYQPRLHKEAITSYACFATAE
nr:MAG TPA: hypothetical protein [Caudoviricetes sp.]